MRGDKLDVPQIMCLRCHEWTNTPLTVNPKWQRCMNCGFYQFVPKINRQYGPQEPRRGGNEGGQP